MASIIRRGVDKLMWKTVPKFLRFFYGGGVWHRTELWQNGQQVGWYTTAEFKDGSIEHCTQIWSDEIEDFIMKYDATGGMAEKNMNICAKLRNISRVLLG